MGRDVAGFHIDKNSNAVNDKSNGVIRVAPKALPEKSGKKDCETKDHIASARLPDECNEKQDVLGVKSTNHRREEKIRKPEVQNQSRKSDKQNSCANHANRAENNDSGVEVLPECGDLHSLESAKESQTNAHFLSRKQQQPHYKNYYDEEDNWSLASSTATSVRTRVTFPVAPKFTCEDRLARRKEFYTKVVEKHKALEKEKLEYEARTKEEEQAAINQLRKSMTYKANPVPSFYREGPPPKVELKKLPVTRAKSPNLTRRKSCSDAVKSSPEDKGLCGRATRHSVGAYRDGKPSPLQKKTSPINPKSKDHSDVRKSIGSNKVKNHLQQSKETSENSHAKEHGNGDIVAVS